MTIPRREIQYSDDIGLAVPVVALLGAPLLSSITTPETGKMLCLLGVFAIIAIMTGVRFWRLATKRAESSGTRLIGPFTSREIYIALSVAPFALICITRIQPATQLFYLALIIALISYSRATALGPRFFRRLAWILLGTAVMHLLIYFGMGMPPEFKSFYTAKNVFALTMLTVFFSSVLVLSITTDNSTRMLCFSVCTLVFLLILASRSRATLIDVVLFVVLTAAWKKIASAGWIYWGAFLSILIGGVVFVPLYVTLSFTSAGQELNRMAILYTGIPLFSGRNLIWPVYLYLISLHPALGYGFGDSVDRLMTLLGLPSNYLGLSAHNLYLMVATQVGLIGLAAILLFFGTVWSCLYRSRKSVFASVAGPAFLTCLANDILAVSFTQTNFYAVLLAWWIIGFAMRENFASPKGSPLLTGSAT